MVASVHTAGMQCVKLCAWRETLCEPCTLFMHVRHGLLLVALQIGVVAGFKTVCLLGKTLECQHDVKSSLFARRQGCCKACNMDCVHIHTQNKAT